MAQALGGEVAQTGAGVRRHRIRRARTRLGHPRRAAGAAAGLDVTRRRGDRRSAGDARDRVHPGAPVAAFESRDGGWPEFSSTPRWGTPPTARTCCRTSSVTSPAWPPTGPRRASSRPRSRRSARWWVTAAPSAGCPAGSTPRWRPHSCTRGDRGSTHLRLRGSWAAAGG